MTGVWEFSVPPLQIFYTYETFKIKSLFKDILHSQYNQAFQDYNT